MSASWHFLLVLYIVLIDLVSGLSIKYCSGQNTGSTPENSTTFQSNGLCFDYCKENYAFAINQDHSCWCSNIAPGKTVGLNQCDEPCPGFPSDICGGSGVFAYQALSIAPSGTASVSTAAPSTSSSKAPPDSKTPPASSVVVVTTVTPPTPEPVTILQTVTQPPSNFAALFSTDPPTSTSSTSTTSTTSTSSSEETTTSTWTPTPVISLQTITGQVRTVTVTPTAPPNSSSHQMISKSKSGGISTGGAVGLSIGLIALTALVCTAIYFLLRKRKQKKEAAAMSDSRRGSSAGLNSGPNGPTPQRSMSASSKFMLNTDGRQVLEDWEPDHGSFSPKRKSRLTAVDPRLDPYNGLYSSANKSEGSINTIRDDRDYSRRVQMPGPILRMTNPDE